MSARPLIRWLAGPFVIILVGVPAFVGGGGAPSSPAAAGEPVTEAWAARYNGPANSSDYAYALAVDGSGNVYVTGESQGGAAPGTGPDYATVKYDASGTQQWAARYGPFVDSTDAAYALAVDGAGNVYVTGGSNREHWFDYATVKYNPSGVEQWVALYDGYDSYDEARALAIDGAGNVYVTGRSFASMAISWDYATVKYNASGVQQWLARYNGPGSNDDCANDLALDGVGNVYVTGHSWGGAGTGYDYATVKYNASGVQQWVARHNGPGNGDERPYALAVDGSGNVYVTGYSYGGAGTDQDYATVKYDASGVEQWVSRYNGPGNGVDEAHALAVDGSGNVYVTGYSYGGASTDNDYATVKYNASGVEQWVSRYNGPGSGGDGANALALDASGNVYVTGSSAGAGTGGDYATVKYSADGVEQWVARYNGPASGGDGASALALDGSGNIYVTGSSTGAGSDADYATIKYSQSAAVGGIAELPDLAGAPAQEAAAPAGGSGWSAGSYAALAGVGVAAAVLVTAAGAWYVRRRWLR